MTVGERMGRVLVTRPRADSAEIVAELSRRGFEPYLEPLLEVRFLDGPAPELAGVQALVFTSANGVRAFARRSPARCIPAYAVGDATARAARAAGFDRVTSSSGTVEALAALVICNSNAAAGKLLHIAGSVVAGDLAGRLSAEGFQIDRAIMYAAEAADRLSTRTKEALRDGAIDYALFFSPRTARIFVNLAEREGLVEASRRLTAICLSPAVADALRDLSLKSVRTAHEPGSGSLLKSLEEAEETGHGIR